MGSTVWPPSKIAVISMFVAFSAVALIIVGIIVDDRFGSSRRIDWKIVDLLLMDVGTVRPFTSIKPDRWDIVCYLADYEAISKLPKFYRKVPKNLSVVTGDRYFSENEYGLAFIYLPDKKASIHGIRTSFDIIDKTFYNIRGERCLDREDAYFRVDPVVVSGHKSID